ncbi:chemotaxis protein CheW [Gracilimonas mengyeensis]|uniref:Purine-binding chemotaxis protein CheW n=1 Tax=Gracilimonas mengyeensis TaxID=1302730 RepID=A0A521DU53_9BACT|nr:chemotaxis protein CheW [Gracilimonas mengyeensis]SMO75246.1 purine-binding chemotaxis protein CheW [Gracilimonas mengyeensis]
MLYLSFTISGSKYAVPVSFIEETIQSTAITRIPKMPNHVLGVMNLRGKIVPVYDTRLRMGVKSNYEIRQELKELLKAREQEHINWLKTLENEVEQEKKISVQRDPALCNFGKWYKPYLNNLIERQKQQGNVDNVFLGILKQFDEPHREIHGLADKADTLMRKGNTEAAKKLISHARDTTLKQMLDLFNRFYEAIDEQQRRDVIVVVKKGDFQFGITVDAINTTVEIDELQELSRENEVVEAICMTKDQPIQILNLESFWVNNADDQAA